MMKNKFLTETPNLIIASLENLVLDIECLQDLVLAIAATTENQSPLNVSFDNKASH